MLGKPPEPASSQIGKGFAGLRRERRLRSRELNHDIYKKDIISWL